MTENVDQDSRFQNMIIPFMQNRDSKSPPKAQVDEASLQLAMDKNKESLKVKLMTRRPINQLVEQGIMPSLKVPPHFHEQRQKLERAKMGDLLKNKIQRRPDRQELIQQHILEDTTVDPSLQDKQRQLKKARLADDLNDRLSHRPGPLELVKGNILHADEKFAQAVREGQIPFKRTCEGQSLKHPLPSFALEDDSGSDVALSPPQDLLDQSFASMPSVETMVSSPYQNHESPTSIFGDLKIEPTSPPSCLSSPVSSHSHPVTHSENTAPKEVSIRSRKKSKPKAQPKTRTIKFHEYKGPPSAQKNQALLSQSETSYELLLQQQQLFLQWQLEWQQKYPQMILPQPSGDQTKTVNIGQNSVMDHLQDKMPLSPPQNIVSKFEDMKVSDLKAELKKRHLPVSGSKPQLIERLKPYMEGCVNMNKVISISTDLSNSLPEATTVPINVSGIILDNLPTLTSQPENMTSLVKVEAPMNRTSPQLAVSDETGVVVYNTLPVQGQIITSRPGSVAPMDIELQNTCSDAMDCSENTNIINENIVKLQQKKIQQLQRELQRSQLQLQQQQWLQQQQQQAQQQALLASQPVPIAPAPPMQTHHSMATTLPQTTAVDAKSLQKLQQHLQQKFQQQQLLQQLQQTGKFTPGSSALSAAVKANLAAFIHNQHISPNTQLANNLATVNQQSIPQFSGLQPIVLCQARTVPGIIEKPRANSLPNGLSRQKLILTSSMPNFSTFVAAKPTEVETEQKSVMKKSPPDYQEATKQLKSKQEKPLTSAKQRSRKSVKSQAVDDVLEILIKNGELPPSAAQVPSTPTTPETQKSNPTAAPVFPSSQLSKNATSSSSNPKCFEMPNPGLSVNTLPSSVLQEADGSTNPPLDFDLHLELHDIEAMDLGVLDRGERTDNHQTSHQFIEGDMTGAQQSNHNASSNGDVDMDIELSDWLDVLVNNNSAPTNSSQQRSYNCSDPLLPNIGSNQETLDMFSLEDIDFKAPSEMNILSWDKVDYAI